MNLNNKILRKRKDGLWHTCSSLIFGIFKHFLIVKIFWYFDCWIYIWSLSNRQWRSLKVKFDLLILGIRVRNNLYRLSWVNGAKSDAIKPDGI